MIGRIELITVILVVDYNSSNSVAYIKNNYQHRFFVSIFSRNHHGGGGEGHKNYNCQREGIVRILQSLMGRIKLISL